MSPGNLEIARSAALKPIEDIANEMGLGSHLLEPYGRDVMKVSLDAIDELADRVPAQRINAANATGAARIGAFTTFPVAFAGETDSLPAIRGSGRECIASGCSDRHPWNDR